ncbi:sensor histidine kinase [Aureimonas pseudogalii]|uniref:histidine kinase n=1 Tax=Aureimonas pseudogalii TaxID=1744844 RepID=A0A7W6E8K0_9HYPH|nr:ATP-binding protein [Aureimonas pseudogalii]MBB3996204.1 two-component system C4-dicarboxylate transport sensor histidine kinase DctB [Aureimonas pseudogalii]
MKASDVRRLRSNGIVWPPALALVAVAVWLLAGWWAERRAVIDLRERAGASLTLAASLLRSEVGRQSVVPLTLAGDRDVRDLLQSPTRGATASMNVRLADLAGATGASALYLIDRRGIAVAASNASEPASFVGSDYRFRDYFRSAMAEGSARQYALGTVSRRPGLYLSQRVDGSDGPLGVVVLKAELGEVEADWRGSGQIVFASDPRGIVLATGVDDWRYRTLRATDPGTAATIRDSLQFGGAPLTPLHMQTTGDGRVDLEEGPERGGFVAVEQPLGLPDLPWRIHLLSPADAPVAAARRAAQGPAIAALLGSAGLATALLRRRRRSHARRAGLIRAAEDLERRVGERTADLRDANDRLQHEIAAREISERRLGDLRRDLEQANRLATLGQITAGVAHEINQPLAALRTYAENAGRYLERGDAATATGNMATVVALTDRIAAITQTLRGFARRSVASPDAMALGDAVDGAEMVLRGTIDDAGITFLRDPTIAGLDVRAERLRLEQVLVILMQNAADALAGRPEPAIRLSAERRGDHILVEVADNGEGMSEDTMARLFTPFSTTKARGLGLGLVIAKDIVGEWGGDLEARSEPGVGSRFLLRLKATT